MLKVAKMLEGYLEALKPDFRAARSPYEDHCVCYHNFVVTKDEKAVIVHTAKQVFGRWTWSSSSYFDFLVVPS